jgi:inositol transport system ATP-binding protein
VFDGAEFKPDNPQDAKRLGIVTIYQELSLIPTLTVAENIFIGRAPVNRLGLVDWRRMEEASRGIIARVGLTIDPLTPVSALSVAEQQLVEIARALSLESRLIIMDEPTSALTETEVQKLLSIMDRLRKDGVAIMFVTHRLEEASAICDRMTVLRDGKLAGHLNREGRPVPLPRIIEKMVGRAASELYARPTQRDVAGAVRMSIRGLRTVRDPEAPHAIVLEGVDLDLKAGEILGVAGLVGSGRTELARVLFGIDRPQGGTLRLDGQPLRLATSADAVKAGIFLVPEDRKGAGLLLDLSIAENITLPNLKAYAPNNLVSREAERQRAETSRRELDIRATDVGARTGSLSGGNQQKVVLAKWLAMQPRVMIFDEPTRGIDIGAKSEIYRLMRQLADSGVAVLMISSDMEEVIGVSDRVAVMHEGQISGILDRARFSEENILRLAVGRPLETGVTG